MSNTDIREAETKFPVRPRSGLISRLLRQNSPLQKVDDHTGAVEIDTVGGAHTVQGGPSTSSRTPIALLSFIVMVLVPFAASLVYFVLIASDQYIAEARFTVRSLAEERNKDSADSGVLAMSSMSQDGFIVTSFIHSTEILQRLTPKIDYRRMFTQDSVDVLSRFDDKESNERFLKYWANQVVTYIDGPSGIITLRTRTFSPDDSKALASAIISESELLINELSTRARNDIISRFQAELQRTADNYKAALEAMKEYQNSAGLLSPEARATETGALLAGLLAKKLELETRLFILNQSNAASSPSGQQLKLTTQNLETQIEKLQQEIAGNSQTETNVANAVENFSRLETDRRVAETLYETARRNLDMAQVEAMRKSLYLVVFVPPTVPQESLYPHRISTPLLILLGLTVAWMTGVLMFASIEDHKL